MPGVLEWKMYEGKLPAYARGAGGEDAGLHLLREGSVLHAQLPVPACESERERRRLPQFLEGKRVGLFCFCFFGLPRLPFLYHRSERSG